MNTPIYITFEHGGWALSPLNSSTVELVTACGAIVLNGKGPTSS
jgi:hypothetical protein